MWTQKSSPGPAKTWIWQHGGERFAGAILYLLGHAIHWQTRWEWLKRRSKIEVVQAVFGALSLLIGVIMMGTRHGNGGSLLVTTVDETFAGMAALLAGWLRSTGIPALVQLAGLHPHQICGAMLSAASLALLVAVMEWPVEGDQVGDDAFAEARLRLLLRMHLFGHMASLAYWGGSGCLTFLIHSDAVIPAAVSALMAFIHSWLYRRNVIEYVRACGMGERRREREARQQASLASVPTGNVGAVVAH